MDRIKIKEEAKKIMNNFMSALSNIEVENEFILKRKINSRIEIDEKSKLDEDFKQKFLFNAKKTSGDAILANKGEWTK